jgi:hypothetical protein
MLYIWNVKTVKGDLLYKNKNPRQVYPVGVKEGFWQ